MSCECSLSASRFDMFALPDRYETLMMHEAAAKSVSSSRVASTGAVLLKRGFRSVSTVLHRSELNKTTFVGKLRERGCRICCRVELLSGVGSSMTVPVLCPDDRLWRGTNFDLPGCRRLNQHVVGQQLGLSNYDPHANLPLATCEDPHTWSHVVQVWQRGRRL